MFSSKAGRSIDVGRSQRGNPSPTSVMHTIRRNAENKRRREDITGKDASSAWLRRITGCTYGRAEGILRDHEDIQKDYVKSALNDSTERRVK